METLKIEITDGAVGDMHVWRVRQLGARYGHECYTAADLQGHIERYQADADRQGLELEILGVDD